MASKIKDGRYQLSKAEERYILHWGEMGPRWGVNRTVAQIHALLFLTDEPLNADVIGATLGVARSNISTSIKELRDWKLIHSVPILGQRKEYFDTASDSWDIMMQVLEERMRREFLPTIDVVKECREMEKAENPDSQCGDRLEELIELMESFGSFYSTMKKLPRPALKRVLTGGGKLFQKLLH